MLIAILEDDERREAAMREVLAGLNSCSAAFFDNAPDMIEWLTFHLDEVDLVCLDHDLGPSRVRDGDVFEPGTGRDVSDYLASCQPRCGVVVHSSNPTGAPAMIWQLEGAGWSTSRVIPFGDLEWVATSWAERIDGLIRHLR